MADRAVALRDELIKSLDGDKSQISENLQKANKLLEKFTFKRYESDYVCTKHGGLNSNSYDDIVDSIINSYGLAEKFRNLIKNLRKGEKNATKYLKVNEGKEEGSVVYGKFIVVTQNDKISMAYAMYTASYEFAPNVTMAQITTPNLDTKWSYAEVYPHVPATESFLPAFFENKAIAVLKDAYGRG